jgi:hypothetical protein
LHTGHGRREAGAIGEAAAGYEAMRLILPENVLGMQ